jgi:hypothetical protein
MLIVVEKEEQRGLQPGVVFRNSCTHFPAADAEEEAGDVALLPLAKLFYVFESTLEYSISNLKMVLGHFVPF